MLTINREIREDLLAEKMNQDEGYTRFMTNRQLKRFLAGSVRPDNFNNLRRLAEENEKLKEENEKLEKRVELYAEHNKKLNRDMDESEKYDWKKKYHHLNSRFIALENIEKELKEEINHKNNKLSEWIVENKEIVVENNQLIEDAVENKKLFDTTFGEMMKLKEYKDHSEKCWGDLSEEIQGERDAMRWAEVENRIKEQDEENEDLNALLNDRVVIEDIAHLFGKGEGWSDGGIDFDWESEIGGLVEENEELKKKVEYAGEHTWSEHKQSLINEYMEATDGWMYYRDEFLPTYHPEEADPEQGKALEKNGGSLYKNL